MREARHQRHVAAEHDVARCGWVSSFGAGCVCRPQSPPDAAERLADQRPERSTIVSVVIEPTRPFDQNTFMSPPDPIIDSRNASSAQRRDPQFERVSSSLRMTLAQDYKRLVRTPRKFTESHHPAVHPGETCRDPSLFALPVRRALVEESIHSLAETLAHIGAKDQILAL